MFSSSHVALQCSNDQLISNLSEAHLLTTADISINCNNVSAIKLAQNLVFHSRSKHINLHHHYIREQILHKEIALNYISTNEQPADIFTEALAKPAFDKHKVISGLVSIQDI
jgi:hypothetical protein